MSTDLSALDRFLSAWSGPSIGIKTEEGDVVPLQREVVVALGNEVRELRGVVAAYESRGADAVLNRVLDYAQLLEEAGAEQLEAKQVAGDLLELLNPTQGHDPALVAAVTAYLTERGLEADDTLATGLLDVLAAELSEPEPAEEDSDAEA